MPAEATPSPPNPGKKVPSSPPAAKPVGTVEVDESRNLITMRWAGVVTPPAMKAAAAEARRLLARVRPGFTVVTDLSGVQSMDLDCVPDLTGVMDAFKKAGIRTAIRIVPDRAKDIGFNILAIVHYRRGVRVVTCATAAEAERALGRQ